MAKSRNEIEKYIIDKLNKTFSSYPNSITIETTFKEIYRKVDTQLVDIGFVMDIEEEMEIDISTDDADKIDRGNVSSFIDFIQSKISTP